MQSGARLPYVSSVYGMLSQCSWPWHVVKLLREVCLLSGRVCVFPDTVFLKHHSLAHYSLNHTTMACGAQQKLREMMI